MHFPVTALGPGRRIGIWFQGCSIRCPGCISADTWTTGKGTTTLEEVVNTLQPWLPEAEGVTVSGGEPFDQQEALQSLLWRRLNSRSPSLLNIQPAIFAPGDIKDVRQPAFTQKFWRSAPFW
ncbi:4Fe-4S cluster-binding domain-containing protein [Rhizobium sp. Nf11,1]|uniref:4Fe-4S cluster-binding domain-containing protein n=1 Tax=Rhizobium sp. Nf11,1 TaxID=3404923 RepID=UPI003D34FA2C